MKVEKRINSESIMQQTVETEVVTAYGNSIGDTARSHGDRDFRYAVCAP